MQHITDGSSSYLHLIPRDPAQFRLRLTIGSLARSKLQLSCPRDTIQPYSAVPQPISPPFTTHRPTVTTHGPQPTAHRALGPSRAERSLFGMDVRRNFWMSG